jgi:HSP20 family protein
MGFGLISPTLFDNGFDRAIDNMIDGLFYTPAVANRAFGVNRTVDVSEDDKNYKIRVAAPGVDKEDFEISIDGGKINIQYRQKEETPNRFFASSFDRSWRLPSGVTKENVSAKYKNGILHVNIDKGAIEDVKRVQHITVK